MQQSSGYIEPAEQCVWNGEWELTAEEKVDSTIINCRWRLLGHTFIKPNKAIVDLQYHQKEKTSKYIDKNNTPWDTADGINLEYGQNYDKG